MIKLIRRWLRNAFGFSMTESNGFIILSLFIPFIVYLPFVSNYLFQPDYDRFIHNNTTLLDSILSQIEVKNAEQEDFQSERVKSGSERFLFDPNSISESEFVKLGLSNSVAKRIINYRNAGGNFRVKEDLKKIYGLPDETYLELESYILLPIHIKAPKKSFQEPDEKETTNPDETLYPVEETKYITSDINRVDTVWLKKFRGIGTVYANRIIKFRDKLGGFVSMDQLAEVYGLSEELVILLRENSFITQEFVPKKLNINAMDIKNLSNHPYISLKLANAIVNYRNANGNYNSLEELKRIHLVTTADYQKLIPYLSL